MSDDHPERTANPLPDPVAAASELDELRAWVSRFSTPLLIGIAVLVVAGLILRWVRHARIADRNASADALYAAVDANGFRVVLEEYPDTPSAAIAALGLGGSLFRDGEYEQARDSYAHFVKTYPEHPMVAAAELAAVICLEAEGRVNEALQALETLIRSHPDHYLLPYARLILGRCYEDLGQWDEARAVYEDLLVATGVNETWVREAELALETVRRHLRQSGDAEG